MNKRSVFCLLAIAADAMFLPAGIPALANDAPVTTYEIFTGSFADSDGDGTGDLRGIIEHLDYINDGEPETSEDLGADGIWLTPIFPSPTYHKYDATDYESIDPAFGTLDDFDALLSACHQRGIRLYLDLAVNHTSSEHPWFQAAAAYLAAHPGLTSDELQDLGSSAAQSEDSGERYVGYYNFAAGARDGYAPLQGTDYYYEARFWEGMPDLDLDSENVRGEIENAAKFWLDRGVDGFRLDAVTSYYTDSKNKSIDFLSWLVSVIKSQKPDAYLVGECWADQSTIADYYDSGIDSLFDFPLAGQDGIIANAVRTGQGADTWAKAMEKEESVYASHDPSFINAPFYTNHDMARSAGYYPYDDGTKAKLSGGMNLLMSGNAFVYYGEEVGLKGSGKDENKRAPMPWSAADAAEPAEASKESEEAAADAEAEDMFAASCVTDGPEGMDKAELKYGTVKDQMQDKDSILSYFRQAICLRTDYPVIAKGKTTVIGSLTGKSLAVFTRTSESTGQSVLIAVNTGDAAVRIDLDKDKTASGYDILAASLDAQSEESAKNATSGSGRSGRSRRRRRAEADQETEGELPVLTCSLDGSTLTVPAYGIAVLTRQ